MEEGVTMVVRDPSIRVWACGLFALFAGACSSDPASPEQPSAEEPRYFEDVAPLLNQHCVSCHREDGIAPFALTDFESVSARADLIASATRSRRMPPMPVDNGGSCNTYENARWLSEAEIDLLERWAAADAPEGDPAKSQPIPAPPAMLDDPDALLDIGVDYVPDASSGHDDYRCFIVPSPSESLRFLTSYQVFPGDPRVVHHVIVYQPSDSGEVAAAHELDAQHAGPGYTCFGGPAIGAEPLVLWAPGAGTTHLPEGTGVPLAAGRELVVQIHYNLENGVYPDRTTVGLVFAERAVTPAAYSPVANLDMQLAPGMERVESADTNRVEPAASLKIYGAMPHMHTLGRTLRVDAEARGGSRCLVNVDRWDFHWQNAWWYAEPILLDELSALSIRCGFDTRGRSEVVTWGEGTSDEMCISYFYVTEQ
jgi:hypothetical protein